MIASQQQSTTRLMIRQTLCIAFRIPRQTPTACSSCLLRNQSTKIISLDVLCRRWNTTTTTTKTTTTTNRSVSNSTSSIKDKEQQQDQEWIPPDRPLVGDIGQSHLYSKASTPRKENDMIDDEDEDEEEIIRKFLLQEEQKEQEELRQLELELEQLDKKEASKTTATTATATTATAPSMSLSNLSMPPSAAGPDWLSLRRSIFGGETKSQPSEKTTAASKNQQQSTDQLLLKPNEAATRQQQRQQQVYVKDMIEEKPHTLLSKNEIATVLDAMGGQDITVLLDQDVLKNDNKNGNNKRIGALGLVVVTATNSTMLHRLADALVQQLRRRDLHKVGIVGAELGIEGTTTRRKKKSVENNDTIQNWLVVDCGNYVVHIQDETTRKAIDLEALWSGKDPLFQLNVNDDDAVEDYVAAHPIPEDYIVDSGYANPRVGSTSSGSSSSRSRSASLGETLKQLQKSRWTVPNPRSATRKERKSR